MLSSATLAASAVELNTKALLLLTMATWFHLYTKVKRAIGNFIDAKLEVVRANVGYFALSDSFGEAHPQEISSKFRMPAVKPVASHPTEQPYIIHSQMMCQIV